MMTTKQAKDAGYTIDECAAGRPYAYKGSRFGNDHHGFSIMTELESDMAEVLDAVLNDCTYKTPAGYENCRFCDVILDHEGTFEDRHADDCLIHRVRGIVKKAKEAPWY